jgi:NAD(P)-dependent dehydrogenase (short-subunit alcohol dehydrogenase family)
MTDARGFAPSGVSAPRLGGRRAVVTGAARGIGAEIARSFAGEGARVAVIDVADAKPIADEIDGLAGRADLADADAARDAIEAAVDALGGVDILVNNAGILRLTPLLDITPEEWDAVFAVNTRAALIATQVAAGWMIKDATGGSIINLASMGGKVGEPGQAHYAASKAAVISLTQVAARELGPHGIRVNAICPGFVLTDMGADSRTPEMVAAWSARSPLGRLAEPRDVANMALFLASAESGYCTGQAFNVTGGMIMH